MAKLQGSYCFGADFQFSTCKNDNKTAVYVDEYITSYHVSVKRLGWALPEIVDLIIKKKPAVNICAEIQEYINSHNL